MAPLWLLAKYQNYKFFSNNTEKFLYIDRIAVKKEFRRNNLASDLYKYVEKNLNIKLNKGEVSHLIIATTVNDNLLRQILRQINKLIDVLIAEEMK